MNEKTELIELIHIATDSVREILNHKDLDDSSDARKIYKFFVCNVSIILCYGGYRIMSKGFLEFNC